MNTNPFLVGLAVTLGILIGGLITRPGYDTASLVQPIPSLPTSTAPFCVGDAQAVMAKIRPLLPRQLYSTDASVWLWADGTVNIRVEINGSELKGSGKNLADAVADISRSGDAVKAALAGGTP